MRHSISPARRGFSLVISLIILTLLSVMVVGFLTSTQLDRTTARAFLGKSQAELAAEAAVNQAISQLREHITEYPDSVTFWEALRPPVPSKAAPVIAEGTMLYFNDQRPADGYTGVGTTAAAKRYILPLFSHGVDANGQLSGALPVERKTDVLGTVAWKEATSIDNNVFSDATCVDLNRAQFNGDDVGWIGSPQPALGTTRTAPHPYYARWVELKEKTNSNGKNDNGTDPRVIGRYAFWMEDESFKVNLNQFGSPAGGRGSEWTELTPIKATQTETNSTDPTKAATSLPFQLAALNPIQGILRSARAPASIDREAAAVTLAGLRTALLGSRVPDLRSFNQASISSNVAYRTADEAKFIATGTSATLNLSRHGSQRLNLNGIGFDKRWDDPKVTDPELKKGIDQLVTTIKYHAPKFSQRFYRNSTATTPLFLNDDTVVPAKYSDIYLYKIAANIRDYIDPDAQPTLILDGGKIGQRTRLNTAGFVNALPETNGPNASEIWAQGKDSAPYLQEAIAKYRSKLTGSTWELWVDYYIEFWNMTDRDITAEDLGPNPFLCITSQMGWVPIGGKDSKLTATTTSPGPTGNPEENKLRATMLDVRNGVFVNNATASKGVVFKAGQCTVITTDPDYLLPRKTTATTSGDPVFSGTFNTANVYYCSQHLNAGGKWPVSNRYYKGTLSTGATGIKPVFRDGGEDYETEVVLGNDKGFLDFHASPIAHGGGAKNTNATTSPREDWYGGTLFGNSSPTATPSQLGDPRTNNEQLVYTRFISGASTAEPDQARYWNTTSDPRFSIGYPNSQGGSALYVNPHLGGGGWPASAYPQSAPFPWPDYYRGWNDGPAAQNPTRETAPMRAFNGIVTDPVTGTVLTPAGTVNGLLSVGQLGDVFDPARVKGIRGSANVEGSRGGGRTLRIGQHDDRIDLSTSNAKSLGWASWRLTDFLSTSNQLQLPGAININGLMRDCLRDKSGSLILDASGRPQGAGAALRAACYGMKLFPVTRPNTTAAAVPPTPQVLDSEEPAAGAAMAAGLQNVISQAIKRMTLNDPGEAGFNSAKPYYGPFSERGEISELDAFSTGSLLVTGAKMEESFDRSREELVRRLLESITTRGSVFSVYAVGQSITEGPAPRRQRTITGTHRVKVTFQLVPKRDDGSDFRVISETFDPTNAGEIQKRFLKPHHYDVQILQVSS